MRTIQRDASRRHGSRTHSGYPVIHGAGWIRQRTIEYQAAAKRIERREPRQRRYASLEQAASGIELQTATDVRAHRTRQAARHQDLQPLAFRVPGSFDYFD